MLDRNTLLVNEIAQPLAGQKLEKILLSLCKKLIAYKGVRRGIKEVQRALRKGKGGICLLAADVSPIDVYSHIPLLCEEREIPYVFVRSRLELG